MAILAALGKTSGSSARVTVSDGLVTETFPDSVGRKNGCAVGMTLYSSDGITRA